MASIGGFGGAFGSLLALLGVLAALSTSASADVTFQQLAEALTRGDGAAKAYLSGMNAAFGWSNSAIFARNLPQKLFVIHQFTDGMIQGKEQVLPRPGLAVNEARKRSPPTLSLVLFICDLAFEFLFHITPIIQRHVRRTGPRGIGRVDQEMNSPVDSRPERGLNTD